MKEMIVVHKKGCRQNHETAAKKTREISRRHLSILSLVHSSMSRTHLHLTPLQELPLLPCSTCFSYRQEAALSTKVSHFPVFVSV